jgi:RNA polymerase nonessential primary-like sigma factor
MDYPAHLPREEQIDLCKKAQAGDIAARNKLVLTSMRLVVSRAHALHKINPATPIDDLVIQGSFGLMRAIEKFDPSQGFAFVTYAGPWVDNAVRGVAYADRDLKRTDMRHGLKMLKAYQKAIADGVAHEEALVLVANTFGMKVITIRQHIEIMTRTAPLSLDVPLHADGETTFLDMLVSTDERDDDRMAREQLLTALQLAMSRFRSTLSEREIAILDRRVLVHPEEAETLEVIGQTFLITRERIRQIEKALLERLHSALHASPTLRSCMGVDMTRSEYSREWWKRRKARGLCVCGKKARKGLATCGGHGRTREQNSQAFHAAVAVGKCPNHVRRDVEPGTTRCRGCNATKRAAARAKRIERRAAGLCQCGRPSTTARCDRCKALRYRSRKSPDMDTAP